MAKTKKQGENSACSALFERTYYSSGYGRESRPSSEIRSSSKNSVNSPFRYPKIPNKGRTSNNMCAPLFWRKKRNGKLKGAHQIKSARTLFEMRPLIGTLGCAL